MIAAYISNSLALWSDSVHMLSDVTGFAVALVAQRCVVWHAALRWSPYTAAPHLCEHNKCCCTRSYASKTPSSTHSFGYLRAEVLGALASVMLVWGVTGILVWEAVGRMLHPQARALRIAIACERGAGATLSECTPLRASSGSCVGQTRTLAWPRRR